jgi:3-hydroxyacyl-[acyl-carrier-protein] dehydratase
MRMLIDLRRNKTPEMQPNQESPLSPPSNHGSVTFNRDAIEQLLPHRDHALFLSRASVIGWSVEAIACWKSTHPHLPGHFPEVSIVPGVFLVEAAAQAVGVVLAARSRALGSRVAANQLAVLAAIKECRLHNVVRPGDEVHLKIDVESIIEEKDYSATGSGYGDDGKKLITVDLNVAIISRDQLADQ